MWCASVSLLPATQGPITHTGQNLFSQPSKQVSLCFGVQGGEAPAPAQFEQSFGDSRTVRDVTLVSTDDVYLAATDSNLVGWGEETKGKEDGTLCNVMQKV